ncbi:MAG TPA: extracellular solute-binding protein, partial [Bacillota bacterium]|nr:extracellular solute-binding protein [Bacillota bacterium]
MTHLSAKLKRISVFFLALVFLLGAMPAISISAATSKVSDSVQDVLDLLTSDTYNTYSSLHADEKRADKEVSVNVADYLTDKKDSQAVVVKLDDFAGSSSPVVVMGSNGKLSWTVNVPTSAKYAIKVEYFTKVTEDDIKAAAEAAGYTESEIIQLVSKTSAIQRMLFVDDEILFSECRSIEFDVSWADKYTLTDTYTTLSGKVYNEGDTILSTDEDFYDLIMNPANAKDTEKFGPRIFFRDYSAETYETVKYEDRNEMRPSKFQLSEWKTQSVEDSSGYYTNPFEFYFTEGEHTISFESVREPMAIKSITLYPIDTLPTYEEYLKMYSDKSDADCEAIVIQAEYSKSTSAQTIYQIADTSSSVSQPNDTSRERLNTIGGDKWQYAGDWITWEVDVEQSGFYEIVLRSIQNYYSGTYVSRALYVDGEIPFEEASRLRYNYSQKFTTNGLNTGKTDEKGNYITYKVYLEAGRREISMKVVLGDMGVLLSQIEECMNTINEYRRKLLMVTGPKPDEYRDYNFDKTMPAVLRGFKTQAALLYSISDQLEEIIGSVGDHTVILDKTAFILERMGTYPTKIASLMDDLKDYIGSLGTWLMDTQNQPLLIDYISIQSPSDEMPQADANFFQAAYAEIKKFIASFFSDYNTIGSKTLEEYNDDGAITAWIVTGRDNAKIIRTMINDMFISETNISVNLKLVAAGTLLPATLAGTGPDVSFSTSAGDAINYAIRSAVLPLNDFNDIESLDEIIYGATGEDLVAAIKNDANYFAPETFDNVMTRFSSAALTPITLYGETYGIPETQSFMMLFYRKDILAEMGLEVPKTWDEFYDAIFTLQADNLDIGFPNGLSGTLMLMYQQSETLYKEGNYEKYSELLKKLYPEETVKKMLREEGVADYN